MGLAESSSPVARQARMTAVLLLIVSAQAWSGPLEDARAALKAGKAGEVDALLGPLLSREPVGVEALELSYAAAVADGRPYSAERRAAALLERQGQPPSVLMFTAARVAGDLAKPDLRRDRHLYGLRVDAGWSPLVEEALYSVCSEGGDPALFERLVTQAGVQPELFDLGMAMLRSLRGSGRPADYVRQAGVLLKRWPGPASSTRVVAELEAALNAGVHGLQPAAVFDLLAQHPIHDGGRFRLMIANRPEWNASRTVAWCQAANQLPPAFVFERIRAMGHVTAAAEAARLGEAVLRLEPLVLASRDPAHLHHLLEAIGRNPDVFRPNGAVLVDGGRVSRLLAARIQKQGTPLSPLRDLTGELLGRGAVSDADVTALMRESPEAFGGQDLVRPAAARARAAGDLGPIRELMKQSPGRADIRFAALDVLSDLGDGRAVLEIAAEHILSRPVDFDHDAIAHHVLGCKALTVEQRVAFVSDCFGRTGYTEPWRRLVSSNQNPLRGDAAFQQAARAIKPGARGSDPFAAAIVDMAAFQRRGNQPPPEAHELAGRTLKLLAGSYPDPARPLAGAQIDALLHRYYDLCRDSRDDCRKLLRNALPQAAAGANWSRLIEAARRSGDEALFHEVTAAFLRLEGRYRDDLRDAVPPAGSRDAVLAPFYGRMDPYDAGMAVLRGASRWPADVQAEQLKLLTSVHPFAGYNDDMQNRLLDAWRRLAATDQARQVPFEPLAALLFDRREGYEGGRERLLGAYAAAGRLQEGLTRMLAGLKPRRPDERCRAMLSLLSWEAATNTLLIPLEPEGAPPAAGGYTGLLLQELAPALAATPRSRSAGLFLYERMLRALDEIARRKTDEATRKRLDSLERDLALRLADGAPYQGDRVRIGGLILRSLAGMVAAGDRPAAAHVARLAGATLEPQRSQDLAGILREMGRQGMWEPMHIAASAVRSDDPSTQALVARLRAEAGSHMSGIYPVSERDPSYPLFVAAEERERRNTEAAWALLKANLAVFERDPLKLPPSFVAWAVEQLRQARGEDDSLLLKARAIADGLLARESALTPDLAAAMLLTRAECFRDQRNFEAARLEYQTLRNNPAYQRTPAGRRAMFRDVDLMIAMGNAGAAESTVEMWLSQPDPEVQAQAHFFRARIAFDRQDYEQTRKELEQVFSIDFTHTEARLLHGRWKLATNYEVDDTTVLVGDLTDRTLIRPGQQLTISVQDRNLGVVGGASSIPIVLRTSAGGDVEGLALYPSTRDPHLFRGTLEAVLAAATPSNRVLEVRGDDVVTYAIEPGFLSSRGLQPAGVKRLAVVDDARLAIGAGAPDAEGGDAESELERQLVAAPPTEGGAASALATAIRPGNPLYVVVRDRDRSVTPQADTLSVALETSSGDRLKAFELRETGAHTGVFRGAVPTALPPPRGSASDTAAGMTAADLVNSGRHAPWRCLPDGKPGKWVEVDTMGSHAVAQATLRMPRPEDVVALRLVGRLAGEAVRLGAFPADDAAGRGGIRGRFLQGRRLRDPSQLRMAFATAKTETRTLRGLAFETAGHETDQNAIISGAFLLEQPQTLRLRIVARHPQWRCFASLWTAVAVDGATVVSGEGAGMNGQLVELDLTAGPHEIEIFASARTPQDAFDLHLEQDDGRTTPFPAQWFDPKEKPALLAHLRDRAAIERTADGFVARFAEPVRLRALRWEFVDFAGREITVSKLGIQDADGRTVIPVASDYSDAMNNATLEVAPGDRVTVVYLDEQTSSGEKRVVQRSIGSSFNDATVSFHFEELTAGPNGTEQRLQPAYRFQPGDSLLVQVEDRDADVSEKAETVAIRVATRAGRSLTLTAVEQRPPNARADAGLHSGRFVALLRTASAPAAPAAPGSRVPSNVLEVGRGDVITATYADRENTKPGIPVDRTATVSSVQPSSPALVLYHTRRERVPDTSEDARLRLAQIRRRPGNERVDRLWRDQLVAVPMSAEEIAAGATSPVPVNVAAPVPLRVDDPSRARHAASVLEVEAVAGSELAAAAAAGREPAAIRVALGLHKQAFGEVRVQPRPGGAAAPTGPEAGSFAGLLRLRLGEEDPVVQKEGVAVPPSLKVNGSDTVRLRLLAQDGSVQLERTLRLVSAARLALMDSTYTADRSATHLGERFNVLVEDPDRDNGDGQDQVEIVAGAFGSGATRRVTLTETLPHSGIFTGVLRPVLQAATNDAAGTATGAVATASAGLDDRLVVAYGDRIRFVYHDRETLPGLTAGAIELIGSVHKGADGRVRLFSKRFRDDDMAVLVQFRLAECLFESAKEFRRLKQPERSAASIAEGRRILEDALRDHPDTRHVVEGEYLLANLYQELAAEQTQADNREAAAPLYQEALSRYAAILSTWPDSPFAPRAQYHKALCLEMLEDYGRASEEYVKMTYLFPASPLVGDASIRLATYYYKQEQRYDTAGRIYANFQRRFPGHAMAAKALFMSAQCHMKQAETLQAEAAAKGTRASSAPALALEEYRAAVAALQTLIDSYRETTDKDLRAQALYWAGDASLRAADYPAAYLFLKRTVFEYPETEWARRSRGILLQEAKAFEALEQ